MRETEIRTVNHQQAAQLLHNKVVVVLGDSIQRAVYKDLVLLLQRDSYLTLSQLKCKGELSFEKDCLVEGGRLNHMNNGTAYREVRQYCSSHHLVRFYFITRIFSRYMESILADFQQGLKPDVLIVNSCVWDVSRYNRNWIPEYKENLNKFFEQLKAILPEQTLIVWNMTMPLGQKIKGGFLVPEIQHIGPTLRYDVIEANFYGAKLADAYGLDVLDLHFLFRFSLHHRMKDGVHWNALVHRQITCTLLAHAAQAWNVDLSAPKDQNKQVNGAQFFCTTDSRPAVFPGDGLQNGRCSNSTPEPDCNGSYWHQMQPYDGFGPHFYEDGFSSLSQLNTCYFSFDKLETNSTTGRGTGGAPPPSTARPVTEAPSCSGNNLVMRQKHPRRQKNPYARQRPNNQSL